MNPSINFHLRTVLIGCILLAVVPAVHAGVIELDIIAVDEPTGDLYRFHVPPPGTDPIPLDLVASTQIPSLASLEWSPWDGMLYGFTKGANPVLYSIDPGAQYQATSIGTGLGIGNVFEGALAFAPDGTAYGMNQGIDQGGPYLFTIDLATGEAANVTQVMAAIDVNGMGWLPDSNSRVDGDRLVALDRVSRSLVLINPLDGSVSPFSTAFDADVVGSIGGMVLADDKGYFVTAGSLHPTVPGSFELYEFELGSPVPVIPTSLGNFRDHSTLTGAGFSGLAIIPEPMTLTLLAVGGLTLMRRRRRW